MEKPKDYYQILGVARDATPAAIKRAYRRLAKKYHPDVASEALVPEFQELQAAYETLTDAERRRRYDESLWHAERALPCPGPSCGARPRATCAARSSRAACRGEILLTPRRGAPREACSPSTCPSPRPARPATAPADSSSTASAAAARARSSGGFPCPFASPPACATGTVFQVAVDDPAVLSIFLTVHIRYF